MPVALGFIETNSLMGAAEAANVMAKTSNAIILGKEIVSTGLITVKIIGDEESVESAINTAVEALKNLERNVSSHIIIDPDEQVFSVLPELRSLYYSLKKIARRKVKKSEPEKTKIETEKIKPETAKQEAAVEKSKARTEKSKAKAKKLKVKSKKQKVKTKKPKVKAQKADQRSKVKSQKSKVKSQKSKVKELQKSEAEIKEVEKPKVEEQGAEVEKIPADQKTLNEVEDIFIVHHPEKRLRTRPIKRITEEKIPEIRERKRTSYSNDTILRLRQEALGLNKAEKKKPVNREIKKKEENQNENKDDKENLKSMNVHQLRKLARSSKNFPIHGREISKAGREILLDYFKNLK